MGKVFAVGGSVQDADGAIVVRAASEVLVLVEIEFLDRATEPQPAGLRPAVSRDTGYEALLKSHAAVHGEMLNRVL